MKPSLKSSGTALTCFCILSLAGCGSLLDGKKIDYRNTSKVSTLEVPPDLTQINKDERFTVPSAAVSASAQVQRDAARPSPVANTVLPEFKTAKIERQGKDRWLVIAKPPEAVYPLVAQFWADAGLALKLDSPSTGIMETDWSENRANIPKDGVRALLGKVLDNIYDSGTRDKFRTRIERRPDGGSDIYLSHRGMVEKIIERTNNTTRWEPRPADPDLEAEFMRRLLVRLGLDEAAAKDLVASQNTAAAATAPASRARLMQADGAAHLMVDSPFESSWRQVGVALDRVGFTVEDRDRAQGFYMVRYVDPNQAAKKTGGLFGGLFSGAKLAQTAAQYRVLIKAEAQQSKVLVQAADGGVANLETSNKILNLLAEDLK